MDLREVLWAFGRLGLTSFGGPIAHIGYFRSEFVTRREWLDEPAFADIVALCQFLPGPASSQVAVSLGILRAGLKGGLVAWLGFTLPSAIALILFAYVVDTTGDLSHSHWLQGLKVVAVAVVAQAVWGMARTLCPDRERLTMAAGATLLSLALPSAWGQVLVIGAGAALGWAIVPGKAAQEPDSLEIRLSRRVGVFALIAFAALLTGLPLLASATGSHAADLFARFYRAGSLVFGGGHVVLPLLQDVVVLPGWISTDKFLAGYGAAQAVPGPLFTFSAYLGTAMMTGPSEWVGGALCLIAIYLPSFLLLIGVLPYWNDLRARAGVQSALRGVNAAVVGILLAALYSPIWTGGIRSSTDFAICVSSYLLLVPWRVPPWIVVFLGAVAGWVSGA